MLDHLRLFRIIDFTAYTASKQMTEDQNQRIKDDGGLGINIGTKLVEVSALEECYIN